MEDKFPEVLNWQQACKLLSCSKSHFYNLVNSGYLASVRSGKIRGLRVKKEDCEHFLTLWRERADVGNNS